jgi:hypothetical protein
MSPTTPHSIQGFSAGERTVPYSIQWSYTSVASTSEVITAITMVLLIVGNKKKSEGGLFYGGIIFV